MRQRRRRSCARRRAASLPGARAEHPNSRNSQNRRTCQRAQVLRPAADATQGLRNAEGLQRGGGDPGQPARCRGRFQTCHVRPRACPGLPHVPRHRGCTTRTTGCRIHVARLGYRPCATRLVKSAPHRFHGEGPSAGPCRPLSGAVGLRTVRNTAGFGRARERVAMNVQQGLLGSTALPAWRPSDEPRGTSALARDRNLFRVGPR